MNWIDQFELNCESNGISRVLFILIEKLPYFTVSIRFPRINVSDASQQRTKSIFEKSEECVRENPKIIQTNWAMSLADESGKAKFCSLAFIEKLVKFWGFSWLPEHIQYVKTDHKWCMSVLMRMSKVREVIFVGPFQIDAYSKVLRLCGHLYY